KKFCGRAVGHLLLQERDSKGAVSSSASTGRRFCASAVSRKSTKVPVLGTLIMKYRLFEEISVSSTLGKGMLVLL
ncbi:unnamed protein product, partial [Heterotrigona itama]